MLRLKSIVLHLKVANTSHGEDFSLSSDFTDLRYAGEAVNLGIREPSTLVSSGQGESHSLFRTS